MVVRIEARGKIGVLLPTCLNVPDTFLVRNPRRCKISEVKIEVDATNNT